MGRGKSMKTMTDNIALVSLFQAKQVRMKIWKFRYQALQFNFKLSHVPVI